jgi:hypothetical protein
VMAFGRGNELALQNWIQLRRTHRFSLFRIDQSDKTGMTANSLAKNSGFQEKPCLQPVIGPFHADSPFGNT